MLSLEAVIATRLRGGLAPGWTVMGLSTDLGRRDAWPLVSVAFDDGDVPDSKAGAAAVRCAWRVTLVAKRGADVAALVDAAFADCMALLHNWAPGQVAGRLWERMRLVQIQPPQYPEDGLVGFDLTFSTQARYDGCE